MTAATAVDYVRNLPPEAKEAVFVDLLKELVRENGDGEGLVEVTTTADGFLGTFYPPKAVQYLFDRYGPKLTPERKAEIQHAIDNPGRTFTLEELLESLEEEDAALEQAVGERGIG